MRAKRKKPKKRRPIRYRGECGCGWVCTAITEGALKAAQVEHDNYMVWKLDQVGVDLLAIEGGAALLCGNCQTEFTSVDQLIDHLSQAHGL